MLRLTYEAVCRITSEGRGEIDIRYTAVALGEAPLSRVRLLVNGIQVEDSGPLAQRELRRIATVPGQAGRSYTYIVLAEADGAQAPRVQNVVQCPQPPTPAGPRL